MCCINIQKKKRETTRKIIQISIKENDIDESQKVNKFCAKMDSDTFWVLVFSSLTSFAMGWHLARRVAEYQNESTKSKERSGNEVVSSNERHKMVMLVRTDLGMTKGKMCAQCAHASLGAYRHCKDKNVLHNWERNGQAKIALKVQSEQEMLDLRKLASEKGINHYLVVRFQIYKFEYFFDTRKER